MFIFDSIFGSDSERFVKGKKKLIAILEEQKKRYETLSDGELKEMTHTFKQRIQSGESLESLLPEAFAVVAIVAKRTTGMDPFTVQFIGGMALHEGAITEMRTGEGKTLVAVPTAYLNALTGKPVHIVTVNDYLARRDAVWMGQIYASLGLSIGVINSQNHSFLYDPGHKEKDQQRDTEGSYRIVYDFLRESTRKEAYTCDIVYGANNEYVFDYLRDNIAYNQQDLRQRGHYFAIIDEVDSVLIDEARSPLIISSPINIPASQYQQFAIFADSLKEGEEYEIDEKQRSVALTEKGIQKFEEASQTTNVYVEGREEHIHRLENALKAKSLYIRDKQYVIQEGRIVIVDEFTGRLQPGRQWSEGLHQAIEAKEGVEVQQETRTYASITYQNYFRMYEKLSGMTGTALSSAEEFLKVYNVPVVSIPTNKTVSRIDHHDNIYQTKQAKQRAVVKKIEELHKKGQPVLVGTISIEQNEALAKRLKRSKIPCELLNAKNHEREGEIIAAAGKKGMVTIATNLAGRGVDIKLGGIEGDSTATEEVREFGGLFVLGTERHESRRIDDQLRGRCGRQGDVGETQFFISLEDDLARIFGSEKIADMAKRLGLPEDQVIQNRLISKSIESAQKKIEGNHFDMRRFSLQYDTVLNQHRVEVYKRRKEVLIATSLEVFAKYCDSKKTKQYEEKMVEKKDSIEAIRLLILRNIDGVWMEHLEAMDHARSSVNLRSYGQREPLLEYRKEALRLFENFWERVQKTVNEEVEKELELQEKAKIKEEEK